MKPLLFFAALTISISTHAQSSLIAMNVETSYSDTTVDGTPIILPATLFTTMMNINVDRGDSIYKLHVKVGSTPGGSEFISASFDYNVTGTFGATTYAQIGNNVSLGLGAFAGMIHYYAEVQVETISHNFETPLTFSR